MNNSDGDDTTTSFSITTKDDHQHHQPHQHQNVFLREDFDPLTVLLGDDLMIVPPISNVKPYKTFDAVNLDQLLLKKQQQIKKQAEKKKQQLPPPSATKQAPSSSSSDNGVGGCTSVIIDSSSSSSEKSHQPMPMNIKDLPVLAHSDTYRGFLEHKYGQPSNKLHHSFDLLYQSVMNKSRVGVVVRTRHGGQSKLEGLLSGFDKFFNMILLDVKEHYMELQIRFKKQKILDRERGLSVAKKRNRKRRVRCLVEKEREFALLFVKGCQVVSVMVK